MTIRRNIYRSFIKPVLDRVVAATLLVLVSPLLLVIAAAVRIVLGAPILFTQVRPGKDGRPFRLVKFRTMRVNDRNFGDDERRTTPLGQFLRRFSLDELPQLWNVLRGDMSLVGPRPLLVEYLQVYTPEQARRNEVRPGVTGWSQVHGRNHLDWDERLRMDVWYVDHASLWLDLWIIVLTIAKAFTGRDACPATLLPGSEHFFDKDVNHEQRPAA